VIKIDYNDLNRNFHKRYGNLILTEYQVDILNKYSIDYNSFNSINELIYYLENYLNNCDNDELEIVSSEIAEYNYYHNTNK
jgi:hypothetical protein